jgi:uncharacterized RmlC-like cupin family protein
MPSPKIITLDYTYKKPDVDVWILNTDDIPIDKSLIKDQQIVHLAPRAIGGNHKHPRTEWFIGIGDLVFVWLDEQGIKHEEYMHPNGEIKLITVPSLLPHAVVNKSKNQVGVLFEFADGKQENVEQVKVV